MSIVDFFLESRQVDSIKLSILLEHLAAELDTARKAALETNTREQWDAEVLLPRLTFSWRRRSGASISPSAPWTSSRTRSRADRGPADPELGPMPSTAAKAPA